MFGNHFVLLHFSHDDDDAPDSVEGKNKLRSLCVCTVLAPPHCLCDRRQRPPGYRFPVCLALCCRLLAGRSLGVIAWHAVALLVRLL